MHARFPSAPRPTCSPPSPRTFFRSAMRRRSICPVLPRQCTSHPLKKAAGNAAFRRRPRRLRRILDRVLGIPGGGDTSKSKPLSPPAAKDREAGARARGGTGAGREGFKLAARLSPGAPTSPGHTTWKSLSHRGVQRFSLVPLTAASSQRAQGQAGELCDAFWRV